MTNSLNILITGTSGFLGGHIKRRLHHRGHSVMEIKDRKKFSENLQELSKCKYDVVIHCGFEVNFRPAVPDTTTESVNNTLSLIDFAKNNGCPHFIFLSAAGALGVSKSPRTRDETCIGHTDSEFTNYLKTQYIKDKITCETYLNQYQGISTVLYLTTIYGKGMNPETLQNLRKVKSFIPLIPCPPGGTSYLDLNDFLSALEIVLEKKPHGNFTLSSGNLSYAQLYKEAAKVFGVGYRKKILVLPESIKGPLLKINALFRKKHLTNAILDSTFGYKYYTCHKATRELRWEPQGEILSSLRTAFNETDNQP